VSQPAATEDTIRLAFEVFDKSHVGNISKKEFNQVLDTVFECDINRSKLYDQIEKVDPEQITSEELYMFAKKRPEYAKIFLWYKEMMPDFMLKSEIEIVNAVSNDKNVSFEGEVNLQQITDIRLRKTD